MRTSASANGLMRAAVLMWVLAWWLIDIAGGQPVAIGLAAFFALIAQALATGAVNRSVDRPSPWRSAFGRLAWALRPRPWMLAWAAIVAAVAIFGAPMMLYEYGGGRCLYIDWRFAGHIRPAQGDGAFDGCRFLAPR